MMDLAETLLMHQRRIQDPTAAQDVWDAHLTQAERNALGGVFDEAYRQGRTVGIWSRAKGISPELATIELARIAGMPLDEYRRLLMLIEEPVSSELESTLSNSPVWDADAGCLYFRGRVIRRVKRSAFNIRLVLDEFQLEGWRPRIDSPISDGDAQKVAETVRRLNQGLSEIRFRRDGSGQGITWSRMTNADS